ncbi:MAG: lamin tail domain-containing protein [Paludibacter sp.]|nr:lamin tail domain-containing protein [Paludibacter sp.]
MEQGLKKILFLILAGSITIVCLKAQTILKAASETSAPEPTIVVTDISNVEMNTYANDTAKEVITVQGNYLTDNISLSVTGADKDYFSLYGMNLIPVNGTVENTEFLIKYFNPGEGVYNAVLTISSPGATLVTRTLSASSVWRPLDTPIATDASNINASGFTANWESIDGANAYNLYVSKYISSDMPDLIISEYGEGYQSNKYLELYNGTGQAVDLSEYTLMQSYNGAGWPTEASSPYYASLSGTLPDHSAYVLTSSNSSSDLKAKADKIVTYSSSAPGGKIVSFSGDDAIGLFKNGVLIDVVGFVDEKVSASVAGVSSAMTDHSLVRKPTVTSGNTDWSASAGTDTDDSEWIVLARDVWDSIGFHTYSVEPQYIPVDGSPFTVTDGLSKVIDNLSSSTTYSYYVVAKDEHVNSENSNLITVMTSGVTNTGSQVAGISAYIVNQKLMVKATAGQTIEIYNALGQKLGTYISRDGLTEIQPLQKGLLIVRIGNFATKVIL